MTLSRRDFLSTAAAGAAALGLERRSFAAQPKYDLLIRGGRVIDPSLHLDGIRDVAITAGRIVLVDANITAEAADTIDARGRLVVYFVGAIVSHVRFSDWGVTRVDMRNELTSSRHRHRPSRSTSCSS